MEPGVKRHKKDEKQTTSEDKQVDVCRPFASWRKLLESPLLLTLNQEIPVLDISAPLVSIPFDVLHYHERDPLIHFQEQTESQPRAYRLFDPKTGKYSNSCPSVSSVVKLFENGFDAKAITLEMTTTNDFMEENTTDYKYTYIARHLIRDDSNFVERVMANLKIRDANLRQIFDYRIKGFLSETPWTRDSFIKHITSFHTNSKCLSNLSLGRFGIIPPRCNTIVVWSEIVEFTRWLSEQKSDEVNISEPNYLYLMCQEWKKNPSDEKVLLQDRQPSTSVWTKFEKLYLEECRQVLEKLWARENEIGRNLGTLLHKDIELFLSGVDLGDIERDPVCWQQWLWYYKTKILDQGFQVYRLEWRIFDLVLKSRIPGYTWFIPGTPDALFTNKEGVIDLHDWKRSKELVQEKFGKKMKHHLSHLDDCNFIHYALSLNIYKIILDRCYGVKVRKMYLGVFHPNTTPEKMQLEIPDMHDDALNTINAWYRHLITNYKTLCLPAP